MNVSSNMISVVEKCTFCGLDALKVLDLSNNKLNILNTKSFFGLVNMTFLKINHNPLQYIHINLLQGLNQIKLISTDNFRLCCIKPRSDNVCNSVIRGTVSCKDLISSLVTNVSMWVIILLVLILNTASIVNFIKIARKERKKNISTFQIIVVWLNISDFACGMYLAIIISSNIYFKGSYAINELHWRSHIACNIASHICTFFQISSLSTVVIMTFVRLQVVIDPFQSKLQVSSFSFKNVLSVILSISFTSVLLTNLNMFLSETNHLPSGLCSIFYDPMGHMVNRVSAIILSLSQLITCGGVIWMYVAIYNKIRVSFTEETSGVKKILQRKMIFKIVLITDSYIACWIPSVFIYMFLLLDTNFLLIYNGIQLFTLPQ